MHTSVFQLPIGVRDALAELARKWSARGVVLSVFGSFAAGTAARDSDLDLAVEWTAGRDATLHAELMADIEALPTVRPIDVVDLSEADAAFVAAIRPSMRRVA